MAEMNAQKDIPQRTVLGGPMAMGVRNGLREIAHNGPRQAPGARESITGNAKTTERTFRETGIWHRLSDEQRLLYDIVRKFTDAEIAPLTVQMDRTCEIPPALIRQLKELSIFALTIPERYGGVGAGETEVAIVHSLLAYGSGSVAILPSVSGGLFADCLLVGGTEEQKQQLLPRIATGEIIGCFGLTEPDCGSDVASMKARARKVEGGWELTGAKAFITNGPFADFGIIFAKTGPEENRNRNISAFIVPRGEGGFEAGPPYDKAGWRASKTSHLTLDSVFVPDENLVGGDAWLNKGFKLAMMVLERGRISVAAQALGVAERAFDEAVRYAEGRPAFGTLLSQKDVIRAYIADMATCIGTMRSHIYDAAWLADNGRPFGRQASEAKLEAARGVEMVANLAVQIHGGNGFMVEYPVNVCWRDSKLYPIGEGTNETQQIVIARDILGY